jgi:hypothetical protein
MKVRALTNKIRNLVYYETVQGPDFFSTYQMEKTKLQQAWIDHEGNEEWQDVPTVYELENND